MNKQDFLFSYKVNILSFCVHSEREEGIFGSWSESYNNSFESIEKTDSYPDVNSPIDLEIMEGYLVWVEYSSGDSYGKAEDKHVECIGILPTRKMAEELSESLENWTVKQKDTLQEDCSFTHKSKDGQIFEYKRVPWADMFSRLGSVRIQGVKISE